MDESRYLEDLKVIREVLRENEERPLVEWWAFLLWGVLVFAGTFFSAYLIDLGMSAMEGFLYVWVPVLILGSAGEIAALLKRFNKEETPLFTRRYTKLFGTFFLVTIALLAVLVPLIEAGVSPGTLLVVASVPIIFYAYATFASLFVEASAMLVLGIFLEFLPASPEWLYVAVGVTVGAVYSLGGLHTWMAERRKRG